MPMRRLLAIVSAGAAAASLVGAAHAQASGAGVPCRPVVSKIVVPGLHVGDRAIGRVAVSCRPDSDVVVRLASTKSTVRVPERATVAAGSRAATFPVSVDRVDGPSYHVRISAEHRGVTSWLPVRVDPGLKSIVVPPSFDSLSIPVYVELTGPAPAGGTTVALSTDNPAVNFPDEIVVGPGFTSGGNEPDHVLIDPVDADTEVRVTASLGFHSVSATRLLTGPPAATNGLTVTQYFRGDLRGSSTYQDYIVRLSEPAPPGGLPVDAQVLGDDPEVTLDLVTDSLLEGETEAQVFVHTADVDAVHEATIEVTVGAATMVFPIVVRPNVAEAVAPEHLHVGERFTGTVSLKGPSDVDTVVQLTPVSSGFVQVPTAVLIPAGTVTVEFDGIAGPFDGRSQSRIRADVLHHGAWSNYILVDP
jgi:hypothetical protein